MTVEELKKEAAQLPEKELGMLVVELLATFGPPERDVSDAEVARRVEELDIGVVQDISLEEMRSRVEHARRK